MNKGINYIPAPWQRIETSGIALYLNPEKPDWFVPGPKADQLLLDPAPDLVEALARELLVNQITSEPAPPYQGRASHLKLERLQECWFHLTSKCNLACGHCLFGSSPAESETLPLELLQKGLAEARQLGATLFYFTGGEPFVYSGFTKVITDLLKDPDVHVAILTNGLLVDKHLKLLRNLPKDRLHFQVSLDGLEEQHDKLRGRGNFARLMSSLDLLLDNKLSVTLAVVVNRINANDLPEITSLAAERKISNLHFLWHFIRGKGNKEHFVAPSTIFAQLRKAHQVAKAHNISIDNIESIRSQVFSSPGTRFDLSNTAWESLAIGPDGNIYPSPALVGIKELNCGTLADGLEKSWRNSKILGQIRNATLLDSENTANRSLRFLTGGGDIDHSYLAGGTFAGNDPYLELYDSIALWLIAEKADQYPLRNPAEISLRMGDVRFDCPDGGHEVSLTHCNCLISLAGDHGHQSVKDFYGRAAQATNSDIVNPFGPHEQALNIIPMESKARSYGCGSPVCDAEVRKGETLVDLGSGSGVECFVAAAEVGPEGRVFGIDMTDEMLALARSSQKSVAEKLGYDNLEFRQGYLENIPLEDDAANVVISNCVINLSPDKRATFHEIYRVLKPGGRLVVSDIVTDEVIPVSIKNNDKFRGECLGGALQQEQLLAMLRSIGFVGSELVKRFPYRLEEGTRFYSLTFRCYKPAETDKQVEVIYRGPLNALAAENGQVLIKGKKTLLNADIANRLGDSLLLLDQNGQAINQIASSPCCGPDASNPLQIQTIAHLVSGKKN